MAASFELFQRLEEEGKANTLSGVQSWKRVVEEDKFHINFLFPKGASCSDLALMANINCFTERHAIEKSPVSHNSEHKCTDKIVAQ
ncbi:hypothetical protein RUM43_011039 [Polyplax serrata]|uniref:Uncharacterized protein n=1 Tax=Polyplax serrata TaxID=468196 RepID=A0AAN8NSB9_POLSC